MKSPGMEKVRTWALTAILVIALGAGALASAYYLGIREGYRHFEVQRCWVESGSRSVVCYHMTE